jgi:hypothetical protein
LQLIGAAALARLMYDPNTASPDLSWLLFGPTDEAVMEPAEGEPAPAFLLAAE